MSLRATIGSKAIAFISRVGYEIAQLVPNLFRDCFGTSSLAKTGKESRSPMTTLGQDLDGFIVNRLESLGDIKGAKHGKVEHH
jgi:hypothetical protein